MRELRTAVACLVLLTVALGLAYPVVMTGAGGVLPSAHVSIGHDFSKSPDRFQARPSVTGYAVNGTFFNNQGPNQKALAVQLRGYVRSYLEREGRYTPGLTAGRIPADAVTTSASGIDGDVSVANARIQAHRVAARTGLPAARVRSLIDDHRRHGDAVDVTALNTAIEEATR